MRLHVPKESDSGEARVGATPETVKKLIANGFDVSVEKGAGSGSRIPDGAYEDAGASLAGKAGAKEADAILKVRRPSAAEAKSYKRGAVVLAIMDPYGNREAIEPLAKAGITAFSMELMPRITRAQTMDVLSSQANLAGYQAVIDAAAQFDRAMPMMMTAAGTVPAAKVFVMGAGVAGLQAIATARRLGAQVTATDVRPAAKEQVASLGAKFVAVEDDEFKAAEDAGGYAKEMSAAYREKQAKLVADHIAKQDIVITTALIPGRPAPKLVSSDMVRAMKPGSVIIDLAVERGGNVEGAKHGETVDVDGVSIVGHANVPGRIAATASQLYAKNLLAFLDTMVEDGAIRVDLDEELQKATALTHDGRVVHKMFEGEAEPKGAELEAATPVEKPGASPSKSSASKSSGSKATGSKAPGSKSSGSKATGSKASETKATSKAASKASGKGGSDATPDDTTPAGGAQTTAAAKGTVEGEGGVEANADAPVARDEDSRPA